MTTQTQTPAPRTRSRAPASQPAAAPAAQPAAASATPPAAGRIRSRTAPAAAAPTTAPAGATVAGDGSTDWMRTGNAARQGLHVEREKQAERREGTIHMPTRLMVPSGVTKDIVVLDAAPGPCMYEHNLRNPRTDRFDLHELCPKEFEPCPICDGMAGGKDSAYVMFLTVADMTPWERVLPDGSKETVAYTRRLWVLKGTQQDDIWRLYDQHGTLRGLQLLVMRGHDRFAPASGSLVPNQEVMIVDEQSILDTFGGPEVWSEPREGEEPRLLKGENADTQPFEYGRLFRKPSAADLRQRYGGVAPVGSDQSNRQAFRGNGGGNGAANTAVDAPW
jgi:hypothetical protein